MRRLHGAFIAFALAALAAPATAAEISRVASSGEPNNPFDLDLGVRWERSQERATITREGASDELRYVRTRNAIVPHIAIGLWHDLEVHFEMPYVLADDRTWRFGDRYGVATGGVPGSSSSIENNTLDPNGVSSAAGGSCNTGPCPLFQVAPSTTVFHGGTVGDLKAGLAWGIFSDARDDTKPFWLVGMDITIPTAKLYEPGAERGTNGSSPYDVAAKPGPFGEKIWKWDVYTVLSKRMGVIDPYLKAHATKMFKSSSTYSNCNFAKEMTEITPEHPVRQMNTLAVPNCETWGADAGAKLPWVAGLTFGTEVVAFEDPVEGQKVSFDFRVFTDYTSSQRFYNELTDATGKLHMTESYLTMGGLFGLYLRASKYVSLQATAAMSTRTAHYITGESLGKNGSTPTYGADGLTVDPAAMNPNFDWRYDAPGRRFRVSEVAIFEVGASGILRF